MTRLKGKPTFAAEYIFLLTHVKGGNPTKMIKGMKYLLFLCMLFLNGYHHSSARAYQATSSRSAVAGGTAGLSANEMAEAMYIQTAFGQEAQHYRMHLSLFENEEDDEVPSFKRHLGAEHPFVFFRKALSYFVTWGNRDSNFYSYRFQSSSFRYLLLGEFRI